MILALTVCTILFFNCLHIQGGSSPLRHFDLIDIPLAQDDKSRVLACVHEYQRNLRPIWFFPTKPHRDYPNIRSNLKTCLLHGEKTDLYFKANYTDGQTVFEVFSDIVFSALNRPALDDLGTVLAKLSGEEDAFNRALKILDKRFVKEHLWGHIENKTIQPLYDCEQPLLLPLKVCAQEMDVRIHEWLLTQANNEEFERNLKAPDDINAVYYNILLFGTLTKEVAKDIFRHLYYDHEYRAAKLWGNGYENKTSTRLLAKLHDLGVKPNALLFEHIPGDERTIFSTVVLKALRHDAMPFFYACNKLSRHELKQAIADLRSLDAFLPWFLKNKAQLLETKKYYTPGSPHRKSFTRLIAAGIYEQRKNTSLLERLCKHLQKQEDRAGRQSGS